ncbi:MAG TPA: hypothetical protein VGF12_16895 [Roseateles sp.]|uniref:hypothetical protein n=1 Tax=Roseateles sp. TaxID=1971397 RepID=UPI002ED9350E
MSHQFHPHLHRRRLTSSGVVTAGVALCAPILAEQRGTLRIEIKVKGVESWQENGSWEKGNISQRYRTSTVLTSDGGRSAVNVLHPVHPVHPVHSGRAGTQQRDARTGSTASEAAKSLEAAGCVPSTQAQQEMNAATMQA